MSSRREQKSRARAERLAREAKLRALQARRRRLIRVASSVGATALVAAVAIAIAASSQTKAFRLSSTARLRTAPLRSLGALRSPGSAGALGPEGVPIPVAPDLASTSSDATGGSVGGIQCLGAEQLAFHIHAHLTVFVNGVARRVPYAVGITSPQAEQTPTGTFVGGGNCFYWLHTHAADGIIHIESPVQHTFTLGNFFAVWGQPLGPGRVGPVTGPVTAIFNGRRYLGDPRDIPLLAHAQIQLDVGRPLVAPVSITFPSGL